MRVDTGRAEPEDAATRFQKCQHWIPELAVRSNCPHGNDVGRLVELRPSEELLEPGVLDLSLNQSQLANRVSQKR